MNLKKSKYIAVFGIFAINFLAHYLYKWFPNPVFSIFFPVNESIWEHMKMIYTSAIIYGLIDYYILVKNNIKFNNFLFALFISAITSIPIYLSIYLPIYNAIGEKLYISISLLFVVIIISQFINYYIQKRNDMNLNIISLVLIIISFVIFGYLTYYPIKTDLFFDPLNQQYGVNTYYLGN